MVNTRNPADPSPPGHVPPARRETAKALASWGLSDEVVDTACLVIIELVTHVVLHASVVSPTANVTLAVEEWRVLLLAVADAHPFTPEPLMAVPDIVGRGLQLVDALVPEAGGTARVMPDSATGGKQINIRLPVPPA